MVVLTFYSDYASISTMSKEYNPHHNSGSKSLGARVSEFLGYPVEKYEKRFNTGAKILAGLAGAALALSALPYAAKHIETTGKEVCASTSGVSANNIESAVDENLEKLGFDRDEVYYEGTTADIADLYNNGEPSNVRVVTCVTDETGLFSLDTARSRVE